MEAPRTSEGLLETLDWRRPALQGHQRTTIVEWIIPDSLASWHISSYVIMTTVLLSKAHMSSLFQWI